MTLATACLMPLQQGQAQQPPSHALNSKMIGSIGKYERCLKASKEAVLFEHQGKGCLTHFWFGGNFKGVEDTRIRYYIDGESCPSIDMQLYMGHGIGFNDNQAPWTTKHVGKIGKQNGIYNNYRFHDDDPLFFNDGLRLTCRNGETEHGTLEGPVAYLMPAQTRFTTYAWLYQW